MSGNRIVEFIKMHAFFLLGGACIIIVGIIYVIIRSSGAEITRNGEIIYDAEENGQNHIANEPIIETVLKPSTIFVEIVGAVNNPGVYELPEGSIVNDVLELAGGATDDADLVHAGFLRASNLQSGMKIIVPVIGEEIETILIYAENQDATQSGGLVNINTASLSELQMLSGVGPVLAQNIINFRETHGNFSSVDELIHVNRIGAVTLENLRPYITVN